MNYSVNYEIFIPKFNLRINSMKTCIHPYNAFSNRRMYMSRQIEINLSSIIPCAANIAPLHAARLIANMHDRLRRNDPRLVTSNLEPKIRFLRRPVSIWQNYNIYIYNKTGQIYIGFNLSKKHSVEWQTRRMKTLRKWELW